MASVHKYIGFVIVSAFGVMFLWGLVAFIIKREPNQWWWRLLAAQQVILVVQLGAGLTLLALGRTRPLLHYAYGAVFPAVVLVGAHVIARGLDDEADAWKAFAVASFFLFGLTLRALTTGLGLP
jgi:hypothetical protein